MGRKSVLIRLLAFVWFVAAWWRADHVPALSISKAERLITKAPEFHRYARLIRVERVGQEKDSLKRAAFGQFTFQYLNAPDDAPLLSGTAQFWYWRGEWHLTDFSYDGPGESQSVTVYNEPVDESNALLNFLRFIFFQPN